jgi:hypothetical protein
LDDETLQSVEESGVSESSSSLHSQTFSIEQYNEIIVSQSFAQDV